MSFKSARQAQLSVGSGNPKGRPASDFYETPVVATEALLRVEEFDGKIWEPACGKGAIVKVLRDHGLDVVGTDLYYYDAITSVTFGSVDFLKSARPANKHIITNPPFSQALEFAEHGVEHIKRTGGKLCLLNRLAWLESIKRKPFFESSPLARVWVFSRRLPMMHRPEYKGKKTSSLIAFAWFVWDTTHKGPPTLGWLDWKGK